MKINFKKIFINALMVILTILSLVLIFHEQIKTFMVHHMQEQALEQPVKSKHGKGEFDNSKVNAVSPDDVAKAALSKPSDAIGKIAIPSIGLKLPIFYGMADDNMVRGACTMRPDEQMGMQGNYTLAGHHMMNNDILFGPLTDAKANDKIYLTNDKKIYIYQIDEVVTVSEYQTVWLDNIPNQKAITLITCASGKEGETRRIVVRGHLIKETHATKNNMKVFAK